MTNSRKTHRILLFTIILTMSASGLTDDLSADAMITESVITGEALTVQDDVTLPIIEDDSSFMMAPGPVPASSPEDPPLDCEGSDYACNPDPPREYTLSTIYGVQGGDVRMTLISETPFHQLRRENRIRFKFEWRIRGQNNWLEIYDPTHVITFKYQETQVVEENNTNISRLELVRFEIDSGNVVHSFVGNRGQTVYGRITLTINLRTSPTGYTIKLEEGGNNNYTVLLREGVLIHN